jgi:uncharacterized protein
MKKEIPAFLLLLILVLPLISSLEVPNYSNKYVNDFGKRFSESEVLGLQTLLYNLDQNTTAEVSVVTINECGLDYNGYAMQIVDKWKIGKSDKDNGLLILYCLDVKKIVVKTGYGLEGILPDSKVGRLLDDYYVPLRDSGKTKEGIIAVTEQYAKVIEENKAEVISGQAGRSSSSDVDWLTMVFWFFIVYVIISKIIGAIYKNKKKKDLPWFFPIFIPIRSGNSSGGFSGGGFGGGGFGGGGFGGGGASR